MRNVRNLLFSVLLLGMLGTASELLLLNHLEDAFQLVPVVLLVAALPLLAWASAGSRRLATLLFQVTMVLFVAAGLLGIVLHYKGAQAFQLEVDPALKGTALFWKTVRAKAPPALAPASMIGLGLIGFAYMQSLASIRRME